MGGQNPARASRNPAGRPIVMHNSCGPRKVQVRCMFDPSAMSTILTSLVGLMGAMVALLSVYFNYKGRHNQFRHVVYNRQMDAYFDIVESMAALFTAAQSILACSSPW